MLLAIIEQPPKFNYFINERIRTKNGNKLCFREHPRSPELKGSSER